MYLENITSPDDIKKLDMDDLKKLAQEMREAIINKTSVCGGHIGPNLGTVEITIALHYVFNSPYDKIVYDVSHQSYCHKMLTGRKDAFLDAEHYNDVSGYSNPKESPHDYFTLGHTSTSISLACGLAKARDLRGTNENVIALIGDGSLGGGEALEGLNYAYELGTNLIIILNDNGMSIAENYGGIYYNLNHLRETRGMSTKNIFRGLGLDYVFIEDGNNLTGLIYSLSLIKNINHPVVVHILTKKGKGYEPAELDKETWHWNAPFNITDGTSKNTFGGEDYSELTGKYLLEKMKTDSSLVAVTSATPAVLGFSKARRALAGKQFVDVGIAEETAVAMISAMAINGAKPVYGVYSTFIQRTYDQLSQDLCINDSPVTILTFSASVYGMNDVTHLGIFDIPLMSNIPNMVYLAPTCKEEYFAMLEWSIDHTEHPVAIRVPSNGVISSDREFPTDYSVVKSEVTLQGSKVAIIGVGDFYQLAESTVTELKSTLGIDATLINPRFLTALDTSLLDTLKDTHSVVVTLEDGILNGGFGEKIASYYGSTNVKVLNYGLKKEFIDRYNVDTVLADNRLTPKLIVEDIAKLV